jgi:hypothetical protein
LSDVKDDEALTPTGGGLLGRVRKAFFAQIRADFGGEGRYRRWLFYLLLALPAVLLPHEWPGHGMHSIHYDLGLLFSDVHIRIGGDGESRWRLHFLPEPSLLLLAPFWCYIASLAWRLRNWAKASVQWYGAFIQAALTSLYSVLVFCFFYGAVDLTWTWKIVQQDWAAIEHAYTFAWAWLPWLYVLGAVGIFATLLFDTRFRPGILWLAHFVFALCFALAFRFLAPIILTAQLDRIDWWIRSAQSEQLEPYTERSKIDSQQLDKLAEIFAATPRLGDAFWRASRRMAHWRGPSITLAIMKRSRNWSDEEGSVYVPLLALLPPKSVGNTLKRYEKSEVASERLWARKFLTELDAPETKETARNYAKIQQ